jgi:hypothetical protein
MFSKKKEQKKKKTKKKKRHRYGLVLGPDCWLEVSLHPEGPVTFQLDQGFPWISLVPEQMLSWYQNSRLQSMLLTQPSQW